MNQPESGLQNNQPPKQPSTLPTIQDLFEDSIEIAGKAEGLNAILATAPPQKWVKVHPFIKQKDSNGEYVPYLYLPIDKVEHLLRKIFKRYSIKITGQGTAFNGVWVTVRVRYFDPSVGKMNSQDGIGSIALQVEKGASPADLSKINNGALSMAFPLAKTLAIKDACDLIGNIFGANLNRRDVATFEADPKIIENYKNAVTE